MTAYRVDHRPRPLVKANVGKAAGVAAGALAIMVAFTSVREGEVRHTYVDRAGKGGSVLTYCYGATAGARLGQTYTHDQCVASLRDQAMKHAGEVQACLPTGLPDETAAAFYDVGYNIGSSGFCRSSIARKAMAGDLAGACRAIGLYVYSNGKDCRVRSSGCFGVAKRRQDEVALCLRGLR